MPEIANQNRSRRIVMYEDNFTIRNVGLNRTLGGTAVGIACAVTDPNGVGVIDNVYLGEGGTGDGNQGIWIPPDKHRGTLIIKNLYCAGWSYNGIYGEMARKGGAGGTMHVWNSYFRDNNISHVRLNSGSTVEDCVIHNRNGIPPNKGRVNSRGLHTFYAPANKGPVRAKNVHINIKSGNTNGTPWAVKINTRGPQWIIEDSQIIGRTAPDSLLTFKNVGSNPNIHVPNGVPTSPQEAANGSNDGSPTTGGTLFGDGGGGGFEPPSLSDVINDDGENELTVRPE